jgi:hypothetical protein
VTSIGDQRSPFGVTLAKAGNRSPYRLMVATMRRIREIRRANFLERRSGPRRGLRGRQGLRFYRYAVYGQSSPASQALVTQRVFVPIRPRGWN